MLPSMDEVATELGRLRAAPADPAALQRARELAATPAALAPVARCELARLLLEGSELEADVMVAHELALSALGRHAAARRLAAELHDRLRVLRGQPQKFGTWRGADGAVADVDPCTTDSERAKWGLPPLAELLAGGARGRDTAGPDAGEGR